MQAAQPTNERRLNQRNHQDEVASGNAAKAAGAATKAAGAATKARRAHEAAMQASARNRRRTAESHGLRVSRIA